eukprot:gnl/TRDRNA2_/TRDRNA2_167074_c1_seq1.p1 gnl/TRDRNA2_/TRDRNA2_167074_c1~~gnl/TRDRNA2_/TRDRNA2_167074_c1_seq1.p1  ORF type:complete len:588 (+),score=105.39 gnl/TRDRNA2_/TRDRNA2_167074_c1_seq1:1-1764(+)
MYDMLCRRFIPTYNDEASWVIAPNFKRLAARAVQYENAYVGSMPCMPARREMHTGRYNFLHRTWGPIEPFDDSMPELLQVPKAFEKSGAGPVHTHKVTDHYHYWEDAGSTYHQRFKTFEFVRGQEGDKWKGHVSGPPKIPPGQHYGNGMSKDQDLVNRQYMPTTKHMPQHRTFSLGLEFLERNVDEDRFYLQIETFDPHEPFFATDEWRRLYSHIYNGPMFDWPNYGPTLEGPQAVAHVRYMYAALTTLCDAMLGRVLDFFDRHNMWEDTMLIVNTDHGFLMGEHDWWGKVFMPLFNEVAHVPFWIHDPRCPQAGGTTRKALVQSSIDIPATVLAYFGAKRPAYMRGVDLAGTIASNEEVPHPDGGLFGVFGLQVNCVDPEARYIYMRSWGEDTDNQPLYEYTLMPTRQAGGGRKFFTMKQLKAWAKVGGEVDNKPDKEAFSFFKGLPVMKIPVRQELSDMGWSKPALGNTLLYDLAVDPLQRAPLGAEQRAVEVKMIRLMLKLMQQNEAPESQYERLRLPTPGNQDDAAIEAAAMAGTSKGEHDRRANGEGSVLFIREGLRRVWQRNIEVYGVDGQGPRGLMRAKL